MFEKEISEEERKDFRLTLTFYEENRHEVVGDVPERLRKLIMNGFVLEQKLVTANFAALSHRIKTTEVEPLKKRIRVVNDLIDIEFDEAGFLQNGKRPLISREWQVMRAKESLIILPTEADALRYSRRPVTM